MPRKSRVAPTRLDLEDGGTLPMDLLLFHWNEPHVTGGGACFCLPDEVLGVVIHRRLPWDPPQGPQGEA